MYRQVWCTDAKTDPYKWPLNIVAQTYTGIWTSPNVTMVYMLGNPVVWGANLLLILLLPLLIPLLAISFTQYMPGIPQGMEKGEDRGVSKVVLFSLASKFLHNHLGKQSIDQSAS